MWQYLIIKKIYIWKEVEWNIKSIKSALKTKINQRLIQTINQELFIKTQIQYKIILKRIEIWIRNSNHINSFVKWKKKQKWNEMLIVI